MFSPTPYPNLPVDRLLASYNARSEEGEWLADSVVPMISQPWRTSGPSPRRSSINRYGKFAQQMWQQLAPRAYSEIPDPSSHFLTLGEVASQRIVQLSIELTGPDEPGESYFEKVGRLEAAKRQAEEIVRNELLIPPTEPEVLASEEAAEAEDLEDLEPLMGIMSLHQQILDARNRPIDEGDTTS